MSSELKLKNANGKTLSVTNNDGNTADLDVSYYTTVADLTAATGVDGSLAILTDKDRGGRFIYDSTATDDGGIVFGKWKRQYSGAKDIKWFGADSTNTSDNATLLNTIFSLGGDYISTGSDSIYRIDSTITLDVSTTTIDWGNAKLDFGLLGGTSAFLIVGTSGIPYYQNRSAMSNVEISGNNRLTYGICLDFNDDVSVGDASSHTKYENINIHGFALGHRYRSRAYLLTFINCDIWDTDTGVEGSSTATDGGENIRWIGGAIFNSDQAIFHANGSGAINFTNTSIDYCSEVALVTAGVLNFTSCHIESGDYLSEPFKISGDGSSVYINGGWILETGAIPHTHDYFVNVGTNCTFTMVGTKLNNTRGATGVFNAGAGICRLESITSYNVHQNDFVKSIPNSLYSDGSFTGATVPFNTFIVEDTATVVSQTAGTNIDLSLSSTEFYSGTKSLKYTKAFGSGSSSSFYLAKCSISEYQDVSCQFMYNKPSASTGYINVLYMWQADVYNHVLDTTEIIYEIIGSAQLDFTSSPSGWLKQSTFSTVNNAPSWATSFVVLINGFGFNGLGESIYFDDIAISVK